MVSIDAIRPPRPCEATNLAARSGGVKRIAASDMLNMVYEKPLNQTKGLCCVVAPQPSGAFSLRPL
jgi:hypothetical protein